METLEFKKQEEDPILYDYLPLTSVRLKLQGWIEQGLQEPHNFSVGSCQMPPCGIAIDPCQACSEAFFKALFVTSHSDHAISKLQGLRMLQCL